MKSYRPHDAQQAAPAPGPEEMVTQIYEALLDRAPDPTARADKVARLASGAATLKSIITEVIGSQEYRDRPVAAVDGDRFTRDSSQFGELWLLLREMVNDGAEARFVVEVGARGRERSNSYDLMSSFGWKGLLIEANPELAAQIEGEFSGLDYSLASVAISNYTGRAQFSIGINDDVSSLTQEAALSWGPIRGVIDVEVRRLQDVLVQYGVPEKFDLLSIDIEGEDIKVFNDLIGNSLYMPKWVIVEASYDFQTKTLEEVGASPRVCAGYTIFQQTRANLLLRRVDAAFGL